MSGWKVGLGDQDNTVCVLQHILQTGDVSFNHGHPFLLKLKHFSSLNQTKPNHAFVHVFKGTDE